MTPEAKPAGLIQRFREELQVRHDARRTVSTNEQWLRRNLRCHRMRYPQQMGEAELLYGSGLRLMEALRLRIKNADLEQHSITVRSGKRDKDRLTVLPASLVELLKRHLHRVRSQHQDDLAAGWGAVELPHALERKYRNAAREWGWQWLFPQGRRWRNPQDNREGRHHLEPSLVQRAVRAAVQAATPSAIPVPLTFWNRALTSAQFRNYSATAK